MSSLAEKLKKNAAQSATVPANGGSVGVASALGPVREAAPVIPYQPEPGRTAAEPEEEFSTELEEAGEFDRVRIDQIEVESVVCGALQRIRFGKGMRPDLVVPYLKSIDANAKVRDDFPSKGNFGARDTKNATPMLIIAKGGDYKKVELVCRNGDGPVTVEVGKKKMDEFLGKLKSLNRLSEVKISVLENALTKGSATVDVTPDESFTVKYWSPNEGSYLLEDMVADSPAAPAATEVKS